MDDMYSVNPTPTPEFKTCMVCGLVDCEAHKDNPVNGGNPDDDMVKKVRDAMSNAWSDYVTAFGEATGADIDEALQAVSGKSQALLHTGKANTYDKDEEEDEDADEDGEDSDEDGEEEDEDGNVKFTQLPPPVSTLGGMSLGYKKKEETDKSTKGGHFYHLDNVKDMATTSAWKGKPHSFRLFRAKNDILPDRVKFIEEEAKQHTPRLKQALYLALEAEARVARQRNLTSGSVDAGQVARLVTDGREDVFAKKSTRKDISTAVVIMLDDSGSMQEIANRGSHATKGIAYMGNKNFLWTKAGAASLMTMILGEVLTQLNIPFGIYSYESGLSAAFDQGEGGHAVADNWGAHFAIQYKSFNEAWPAVKGRMGSYLPNAGSLTYEAAAYGGNLLLSRKEDRKILFHLSDAQLGNAGIRDLPKLVDLMEKKAGIRYVGFGLLEDCFKQILGQKAECIMKIEDLNDRVFKRLADLVHPQ